MLNRISSISVRSGEHTYTNVVHNSDYTIVMPTCTCTWAFPCGERCHQTKNMEIHCRVHVLCNCQSIKIAANVTAAAWSCLRASRKAVWCYAQQSSLFCVQSSLCQIPGAHGYCKYLFIGGKTSFWEFFWWPWLDGNFRLSCEIFYYLCDNLRPVIEKYKMRMRRCVSTERRVATTLYCRF